MPSWFQLGSRKQARGIFSPGFLRSQRSFILGDAGHSGTLLATAGPLAGGQTGFRAGREESNVTLGGGDRCGCQLGPLKLIAMVRLCPKVEGY